MPQAVTVSGVLGPGTKARRAEIEMPKASREKGID